MPISKHFEQQFFDRQYFQSSFGKVESVDIQPSHLKNPIPVLFAPGWRESPELQRDCLYEVFNSQRRVLTLIHPPVIRKQVEPGDYPQVEAQKANTLLDLLNDKGIEQADVITHSEGAINVTIAATMQPERFRNLVLVTPAGIMGKDSLVRVSLGFARHLSQSKSSHSILKHGLRRREHAERANFLQNILFALQEGKAIRGFDIHPLLLELKNKDISIALLVGEKDTVFPFSRVKSHLSKLSTAPNYGFDIFATKPGGHELYSKPKEVMQQVEYLLTQLEII